jgi:class II lanthipeptide synthase
MSEHLNAVAAVVEATRFHSRTVYSWFGRRIPELAPKIRRSLDEEGTRAYVLGTLQGQLYSDFYCSGGARPTPAGAALARRGRGGAFAAELSRANCGIGYWEDGWEVKRVGERAVVAEKDGLRVAAEPDDILAPSGDRIVPGTGISLRMPKELPNASPGFHLVLGDESFDTPNGDPIIRFYWHLMPEGAVPFIAEVTRSLNSAQLPFQAKVLSDPSMFSRCDAGVLYLRRRDFDAAAPMVAEVHRRLHPALRPTTPALTKRLAPGLGFAEQPSMGESYGLSRCGALGRGLIRAQEQGTTRRGDRLSAVVESLADERIDLETPFLNPGSPDVYEIEVDGRD